MIAADVFVQAEDGIRDIGVTGVQACALPIWITAEADSSIGTTWLTTPTRPIAPMTAERPSRRGMPAATIAPKATIDRKSVVQGRSVDLGGRRIIKQNDRVVWRRSRTRCRRRR